jgi:hypothetical protein
MIGLHAALIFSMRSLLFSGHEFALTSGTDSWLLAEATPLSSLGRPIKIGDDDTLKAHSHP